ncbi:hypothetical protein GGX14DRAFT_573472 [Mycena pura]|uniref:Uncharacterized protein n=1 Tax=Mycena pura TaxID=153505 RepID=A0AAD6UZB8_9AGAR|nr:hypothetical protein GGX14DRAFT_573472 [Mycena pura]
MFPHAALTFLCLVIVAVATPAPIDEKLQPIIAAKNNLGLVNPPKVNANAASGIVISSLSGAAVVGVAAVLL